MLHHCGVAFERRVLSTFADFDALLALSPLGKVPVLLLSNGEVLPDSRAIVDHLQETAPPSCLLLQSSGEARRRVLHVEAVALGLAEKTYERGIEVSRRASGTQDPAWMARLERQITSALACLDEQQPAPFLAGDMLTIADVTAAVALTCVRKKLPHLAPDGARPVLETHRAWCETLPAFQAAPYSATEAARSG